MPTTDVTNTLVANISSTEQSTSNVDINRSVGNPSWASNVAQFTTYLALALGNNSFNLPIATVYHLYIKNVDPAANINVSWAQSGGINGSIIKLFPGDVIILWQNPANALGGIITSLSLNASAAGALVEFFLGG
jgi:hypothetical protein